MHGASDAPTMDSAGSVTRAFLPATAGHPSASPPGPMKPGHSPPPPVRPMMASASSLSSSSLHGLFAPGQLLAGRYRIVSLLGRGGMGEVYRADDLTLGVSVALKFLPASIAADAARLDRFRSEVRTTRQISHPNVCRVYDIGEFEGRPYLSMEYVDGEDLASLLRRIGRLPPDKSVQIARQVCAGLAVAHDLGIVHRDLKPANIMLDGRGQARLMDFGVAGYAADLAARGDIAAGTPVYMAPEQLAGRGVTARSDLYALGLVLYELFTGRPAWAERASSLAELRRLHESTRPTSARSIIADLDPAVERVIDRCLDPDPENRPSSAIAVAAALPGGDPLAAALAAGETPSPEMVAQAGRVGAMAPRKALALLGCALVAMVTLIVGSGSFNLLAPIRPEIPPNVLASKARDLIASLGYTDKPADDSFGYAPPGNLFQHLRRQAAEGGARDWRPRLTDPAMPSLHFFYRDSPEALHPQPIWQPFVSFDDPLFVLAGSRRVVMDHKGRLIRFEAIPPRVRAGANEADASPPAPAVDWGPLFLHAGLELERFAPVEPRWLPLMACDARAAWTGELPTSPAIPLRVEGASEGGRVVSFRVIYPWTQPDREARVAAGVTEGALGYVQTGLLLSAMAGGAFLAWRNIAAGRHDRRGAASVAIFILSATWLGLALGQDSFASMFSSYLIGSPVARGLWLAMFCWLFYTALEPVVRRLWPKAIISWARLISGRWRDPLVGGDVLIGLACGLVMFLLIRLNFTLPGWLGAVPAITSLGAVDALRGPRAIASWLLTGASGAVTMAMLFSMLLIGLRVIFRRNSIAIAVLGVILFFMQCLAFEFYTPALPLCAMIAGIITFLLVRIGLLSLVVCFFASNTVGSLPITSDLSLWYAGQTVAFVVVVMVVALYGFVAALGGQRLFSGDPVAGR
ncbi:MAG: serine/threonine protein kinase [Phycisphaerae bacterium]|nr:serine/threonine protein kinase [Phycisphaerae bacterium]